MNDRFKFRVWDNEQKRYTSVNPVFMCIDRHTREISMPDNSDGQYVIEQCTGRKDKNGRLIFEGDVVKTIWKERVDWTRLVKHAEHHFEAYYNGMGLSLRDLKTKAGHVMWKSEDYEVIGNIHEVEE